MSEQLEKNERNKDKIRVVVDGSVIDYVKELNNGNIPSNLAEEFRIDEDGLRYLDIYTAFKRSEYHKYKKLIQGIIKTLKDQIREHRVDEKVMGKYLYFINYHNRWIKTLNLPEKFIINPFE